MNALPMPDRSRAITIALDDPHDFDEWRTKARACIQAGLTPELVQWAASTKAHGDLFAAPADQVPQGDDAIAVRGTAAFLQLARSVILHSDPARHGLLYQLLWQLQTRPGLLGDASDILVRRCQLLAKAVARDIHKMRAFVRFREVIDADGVTHYVAWFEPQFAILRTNARFFVDRFASMRWSILTPAGSLHWDGAHLHEGPPARRDSAPGSDPAEDLWRTYYAAIFNPARLKVGAMVKEMPRRYWKNLPEAELISGLIAGAQKREAAMVALGESRFADMVAPQSLGELAQGIAACRRCAIGCNGTSAVPGTGDSEGGIMIVGEQPGDQEEIAGTPFVGPAGQLLRAEMQAAGLAERRIYITNAVKHFKYRPQGKIRLHQNPSPAEIDMCRWWLESEIDLVQPRLILALGASAARSLLGRNVSIGRARGTWMNLPGERQLLISYHPSYLLRLDDQARAAPLALFRADLATLAAR